MIVLRDYQADLERAVRHAYASGKRAPVVVAPTASGKTLTFSSIAHQAALKGRRVLILVHRRELLRQTSRTLEQFDVEHGCIAAGTPVFQGHPVQVASVQTLVKRMDRMRWRPDLIIVDEAHHATGKTTWGKVLNHYSEARVLGFTATPQRLDGQGLGAECGGFFDALILGPTVAELTRRGYLSPAVVYAPRGRGPDLSGVHSRGGDWAAGELADAMDKPTITGDAVAHYRRVCEREPAIAFCASVAHAEHVAEAFRQAGYQAASVDGAMDPAERAARIEDLGSGQLHVLTSCDIVSEGTDIPVVSTAILLRPTQSLAMYLQQVGRVLRLAPGKSRAVILDHVGNVFRHGFHDDEREWSLAAREKRAKGTSDALPVRQCERCFAVHRPAPTCPRCGFVYPVQSREIEEVAGELEQVDPELVRREQRRQQARAASEAELEAIGRERGYKNPRAWAKYVWAARMAKQAAA